MLVFDVFRRVVVDFRCRSDIQSLGVRYLVKEVATMSVEEQDRVGLRPLYGCHSVSSV